MGHPLFCNLLVFGFEALKNCTNMIVVAKRFLEYTSWLDSIGHLCWPSIEVVNAARYHTVQNIMLLYPPIPSGSTLFFLGRSSPETSQSYKNLLKPTQRPTHVAICWVLSSAVCVPPCENGVCNRPGTCVCDPGWTGSRCRIGKQEYCITIV